MAKLLNGSLSLQIKDMSSETEVVAILSIKAFKDKETFE